MARPARTGVGLTESPAAGRRRGVDAALVGLVVVATLVHLARWPHDFRSDEGLFLHESARILAGERPYRDFFEIVTPGAFYVMALVFRCAGVTLVAARGAMAIVHAATAAFAYLACRAVGVRPGLATIAALAHVTVAHRALPIASPHWFGTLLTVFLLLLLLRGRWPVRPVSAAAPGLVVGLLLDVQHQKGIVMAVGVGTLMVLASWLDGDDAVPWRRAKQLGWFLVGVAAAAGPLLLWSIATAGVGAVWQALVVFPVFEYRNAPVNRTSWGQYFPQIHWIYTWPWLVKYLPAVVILAAARSVVAWRRGAPRARVRVLLTLTVIGAFAVLSVGYAPNYMRLAIVSSPLFVVLADAVERALRRLPASALAGRVIAVALATIFVVRLNENLAMRRSRAVESADTPFGRIGFWSADEVAFIRKFAEVTRADGTAPRPELFVYPDFATLYLTTGARNPTRYSILLRGYNTREQFDETLALLDARRVPYVVIALPLPTAWKDDEVVRWVSTRYDRIPLATGPQIPGFALFRRRAGS
jgi:hypothetical protein